MFSPLPLLTPCSKSGLSSQKRHTAGKDAIVNFIHERRVEGDKEQFFGPIDLDDPSDRFVLFDDTSTMADLVLMLGKFKSKTEARKNGWDKPIPEGFSAHKCGKTHFWVLK